MGIKSYIKNTVKDNSNIKAWTGWDGLKENSKVIGGVVQDFKSLKEGTVPNLTFEQAVQKWGVTEEMIERQIKTRFIVSVVCASLGVIAFVWGLVMLFKLWWFSGIVAFSVSFLMFIYGFQENFRMYQLKVRRLNCTPREWFTNLFKF